MIIAVTGNTGAGKTHWIREQIAQNRENVVYFSPQTESFPIDTIYLKSEFTDISVLLEGNTEELKTLGVKNRVYLEIPWYLDIKAIIPLLKHLEAYLVAVINHPEEQGIGDEIVINPIEGRKTKKTDDIQVQRAVLTGEVLDYASLETFWLELTQGAYGEVIRVKGMFDIIDGQCIYGEFSPEFHKKDFFPLNFPLNLDGRPNRFSGLEIVGYSLDKEAIAQTISDFCLSDDLVNYYQNQVKETLKMEEIA
jgi:G3E family GTPase